MSRDPRVDAYIEKAAPFAQPILTHVRERVHANVPNVEETLKWSMPSFTLSGKILANMAAFKAHASVGFWRGGELGLEAKEGGMGHLGKLTSLADLPANLDEIIAKAAALSDVAPAPKAKTAPRPETALHPEFAAALANAPAAKETLDGFAPSARREYLDWIAEAKQDATRQKRIASAIEWLAEGKKRNWKYENC